MVNPEFCEYTFSTELMADLLPVLDAIIRAGRDAAARGRSPQLIRDLIRDHFTELAAKLRAC